MARADFTAIYDGLNDERYVDTLIGNTGATFSQTDRDAFVDVLGTGALTREDVLRLIVENDAFFNSEYNAAFVEMQYFGYLRRNPQDPPNTDLSRLQLLAEQAERIRRRASAARKWSRRFSSPASIANASAHPERRGTI